MALDTTPGLSGRSRAVVGGRGRPLTITQRTTTALAPIIEGRALAFDVVEAGERIVALSMAGNLQALANEGGRLVYRGSRAGDEFRRMAEAVEKP